MTKVKPRTPKIEPRPPGLDSLPRRGESQAAMDRRLVREAKSHLQKLLRDPYYFEAMRGVHAEGGLRAPPGVRLRRKAMGVMARQLQGEPEPPAPRKRKSITDVALVLAIKRGTLQAHFGLPRSAGIAAVTRAMVKRRGPLGNMYSLDEKAKKLASRLRAAKSVEKRKPSR